MRRAIARSCSTHHARSSNAAASNSKFLNGCLEREPLLTLLRFEKTALHRVRLEEVRRFPLGFYLSPPRDGNDNGGRLAILVRNELDPSVRHQFQSTPAAVVKFADYSRASAWRAGARRRVPGARPFRNSEPPRAKPYPRSSPVNDPGRAPAFREGLGIW